MHAPKVFDSHCHLHDARMAATREQAILRARQVGVRGFMLAGVEPNDWHAQIELQAKHSDCAMSFGIHPQLVPLYADVQLDGMLEALGEALQGHGAVGRLGSWPRPRAVGEIGLDGATPERRAVLEQQKTLFRAQLALARHHNLPVLLHILHAHGPALEILGRDGVPARGGVVHSYSGSAELVPEYVRLGLHISFAGSVTQPHAKKAKAAALCVPPERLLVETDAPDQTPAPHRGRANEPAYLPLVIGALAEVRGEPLRRLAELTENNARHLFGIS